MQENALNRVKGAFKHIKRAVTWQIALEAYNKNGHGILNNRFDDHKKMIILLLYPFQSW